MSPDRRVSRPENSNVFALDSETEDDDEEEEEEEGGGDLRCDNARVKGEEET